MTNDKLLTELRQRLIKINRDKNCSHMDKQVRGLLDLIEEEWTEVGPEPCGLHESPLMAVVLDSQDLGKGRSWAAAEKRRDYLTLHLMQAVEESEDTDDLRHRIEYAVDELQKADRAAATLEKEATHAA